ncbi:MAG: DUF2939 domain-containing protein [Acidisphaera sp.]|nr:DUF2939 domain-containing protein [Acidisphaera sp.]
MTAFVAIVAAYLAMPYVTLWQLADALQRGDPARLQALIDWTAVRSGLKSDISDGIVSGVWNADEATPTRIAANTLPPFGSSFISGIAGSVVDHEVTPEHLAGMVRQLGPADGKEGMTLPFTGVEHAFFDGPASFELTIRCPGQAREDQPLKVRMAIRHGGWKVIRVWISQDLIDLANART